ncbi:MAG: DHH family phosphoesterase [Patescibacteria group bacterium]|nr:DHH family phosphoesterase [Patescibacteria group bacterium]
MLKLEKKAKIMMKRDLSPKQLATDLIRNSKTFLIITHERPDGDAISSCLALKKVLEKMGKKADVIIPDEIPSDHYFLPGTEKIIKDIKLNRDLVINIKKANRVSYNKKEDGSVDLIVAPDEGQEFKKHDVALEFGKTHYDVLVILDTSDLLRANAVYEQNREILSNTHIINIDHHPTNSSFGGTNLIDPSATSTCEILFSLIESLDKNLMDSDVATLLLAGIITDTNRFQNTNTSPKALTVAAQLIAAGARRSEIIINLYKTKSLSTLKLWGKILTNIKEDKQDKIVWSTISAREIADVGASVTETGGVINELISTVPNANVGLLLTEQEPGIVTASMRTNAENVELDNIALAFGGGGHKKAAGFKVEGLSLSEAEKMVINRLKAYFNGAKNGTPKVEKVLGTEKKEVVFNSPQTKISEKPIQKNNIQTEDDLYAPALTDIAMENPNIIETKGSILSKIVEQKKRPKEELDFAKMEQEARSQNSGALLEQNPSSADLEDFDEDYE